MNNKILVELLVPELDKTYNIFLPVNKRVGSILMLLNKAINEIDPNHTKTTNSLYNQNTGMKYDINSLVYETDIRSGTALILI